MIICIIYTHNEFLWVGTIDSGSASNSQISLNSSLGWTSIDPSISNFGASTTNQVIAFDTAFLTSWRTYYGLCPRDAYFSYFGNSPITVFYSTGGCGDDNPPKDMDLAAKGDYVAGVWIDKESTAEDALLIPYLSFNLDAEIVYLPAIFK